MNENIFQKFIDAPPCKQADNTDLDQLICAVAEGNKPIETIIQHLIECDHCRLSYILVWDFVHNEEENDGV